MQRRVDGGAEGPTRRGALLLGQGAAERRPPNDVGGRTGRRDAAAPGVVGGEAGDHVVVARQGLGVGVAVHGVGHLGAHRRDDLGEPGGGGRAGVDQPTRGVEQRVTRLARLDLLEAAVGGLDVGAGVAPQPDGRQVEEDRRPTATAGVDGGPDRLPDLVELAVGPDVGQVREVAERRRDPVARRVDRDAEPVVLAQEHDRDRAPPPVGVARRVDAGEGGGVVGRGVPEGAEDDAVGRDRERVAQPCRARDGERGADRLGRVRPDRARLGRHPQLARAPHLVAPLRDRVVGRRHERQDRVPQRVDAP